MRSQAYFYKLLWILLLRTFIVAQIYCGSSVNTRHLPYKTNVYYAKAMRTKPAETIANKLIVLGRGIECHTEDGQEFWSLSPASQARANKAAEYYHKNPEIFRRMGRLIVCSGSHAGAALKQDPPPNGISEAGKMAAYLRDQEVPSDLIVIEGKSISTFSNFEECLRAGFFADTEFASDDPLLLVASKEHGAYRGVPIARAAYGIAEHRAVQVLPAERERRKTALREAIGGVATRVAIRETQVIPRDPITLATAARRFEEFVKTPALLAPAAIRSYINRET